MPEQFVTQPIDGAPSAAPEAANPAAATDPLAAALTERDEYRDKLLRSAAEFDNYRKRAQRERDDERKYSALPLARDLLPVLDNLQRAVAAAEKGGTLDDLQRGVSMVVQQAREMLAKHHISVIPAIGQPLDPNRHEAITQLPSVDQPALTVLQEVETGYMLHDRVLRPTKVIVSSGPPAT